MAISPSRNRLRGGWATKGSISGVGHEKVEHALLLLGFQRFVDDAIHHLQACGLLLRVAEASIGQCPDQEAAAHEVPLGVGAAHLRQFPLAGLGVGPQIELLSRQLRGERLDFGFALGRRQRRPKTNCKQGNQIAVAAISETRPRPRRFLSEAMGLHAIEVVADMCAGSVRSLSINSFASQSSLL